MQPDVVAPEDQRDRLGRAAFGKMMSAQPGVGIDPPDQLPAVSQFPVSAFPVHVYVLRTSRRSRNSSVGLALRRRGRELRES